MRKDLNDIGYQAITYICDYYDGPMSGHCLVNGELHWFKIADDSEWNTRELLVYPLAPDDKAFELRTRELFEQHVGTWWSRDLPADQPRQIRDCCGDYDAFSAAVADEFPDRKRDERDYTTGVEPVARIVY